MTVAGGPCDTAGPLGLAEPREGKRKEPDAEGQTGGGVVVVRGQLRREWRHQRERGLWWDLQLWRDLRRGLHPRRIRVLRLYQRGDGRPGL